ESGSSFDFLPSVNFDDFHESIRTTDPQIGEFPNPGVTRGLLAADGNQYRAPSGLSSGRSSKQTDSRAASSSSFSRRTSISQRRDDMDNSTMGPPVAPLSIRSRHQSQSSGPAPITDSNLPSHSSRGPRKSVGPGFLEAQRSQQEAAASQRDVSHGSIGRSATNINRNRRGNLQPSLSATEVPRLSTAARASKTKSLLQPSNQGFLNNPPTSLTPELKGNPGTTRSPARNSGQRANTPSSSQAQNKRLSIHHNVGLGARTISPTDARRLKRLSLAPGTPRTPPTPQPDAPQEAMPTTYSPAMVLPKSVTPSSARATPENSSRKSVQPGLSLSTSSSLSSLRQQNNQPSRPSQIISTSRLPTPKPRNVHSSAGPEAEEDVPPVPAIPKAYESPREQIDQPIYPVPQNATPQADELGSVSMIETSNNTNDMSVFDVGNTTEIPLTTNQRANASGRHRRGLTVGNGSGNKTPPPAQHIGKKNLQPLRLPPLNLLPLSAPTTNRIASFPAPSAELDQRHTTPPPKRNNAKTPSTPMTASKATFFSSGNTDDEMTPATTLRSASSHYQLRSDTSAYPPPPTANVPIPQNGARSNTTPFASNSLPKGSGDFAHLRSKPSAEYKFPDRPTEPSAPKLNGPRALNTQKEPSSAHTSESAETEPETPSSGSSLRRKLSMSWKRASSKSSHRTQASQSNIAQQANSAAAPQPPKHNDMPPPKLPASSSWSGALPNKSPSPTAKARSSLEQARRRKPSGPLFPSDAELDRQNCQVQPRLAAAPGKTSSGPPPAQSERASSGTGAPRSASTSVLNAGMQRMLGAKNSINTLKSRNLDVNLDKDDLVADEEMKRLAGKRKDFEAAAKEVDDLRRRARPQERVSPAHALQMVPLNIFERGEIIDYKEVYFCGTKNAKKHIGDLHSTTANFGYDDERGDYQIVLGDHLAYRYEVVDVLGKGSFGQVVRCVDHKTGSLVAIKIIRNKKRFHQQALVEVNILQKLREWDPDNKHSMINFTQHFYFRGHLCISTELLGMNLYEFIKAHEFRGFSLKLIRRFAKQILSSLVLLKGKRVIHCDLKPENILLAHPLHSEIKVIDFGSSCFETEKVYTYIQSRFYRSPEVILGMSYGLPIDMWSLGCILAELLTGSPIFPGEDEREQLMCIMEIFGPPDKHLVEKSTRKQLFFDSKGKPRISVNTKGRRRRPSSKTLEQSLKCNDEAFLDFIARCLRWDPERRMKPEEAVQHEFITGVRRANPRARGPIATNGTSSPIKRFNTVSQAPGRARPLPEPPATSFKTGAAMTSRDQVASNSPVKTAGRRHSTVSGLQNNGTVKRTSNPQSAGAGGAGSGLPRVAQRSVSGKPDLASAAAVASLVSQ
ncbi:hypothetical protein K490DRAFT_12377, partial [Saccharata proteae CBS 121410]